MGCHIVDKFYLAKLQSVSPGTQALHGALSGACVETQQSLEILTTQGRRAVFIEPTHDNGEQHDKGVLGSVQKRVWKYMYEISMVYKIQIFQYVGKIFCAEV